MINESLTLLEFISGLFFIGLDLSNISELISCLMFDVTTNNFFHYRFK